MREVKIEHVQTVHGLRLYRLTIDGAVLLRAATMPTLLYCIACREGEEACRAAIL